MKSLSTSLLRGFTLVELLVVISIIGLLASIIFVNVQNARIAAEDVIRINDLRQIRLVVELYYSDNGRYPAGFPNPISPNGASNWNSPTGCVSGLNWCEFQAALAPYIAKLPLDPWVDPDGVYGYYFYRSSSSANNYQMYGLMVHLRSARNASLMANDGGFSSDYYEIGTLPVYCIQKYGSGSGGNWWVNGNISCGGGN